MGHHVGIDLGGTNIAVGIVNDSYQIVGRGKLRTNAPRSADLICDDIIAAVEMAVQDAQLTMKDIGNIGVGSPGIVNAETGVVEHAANLSFYGVPLAQLLEERFGRKVHVENDANAAAYGEAVAGAAKGVKNVLMITLGTGVGSGIIIDGKIYSGAYSGGGEFGHAGMFYNGWQCTCGQKGCVEAYCSATGLIRLTKEVMEANRESLMWAVCMGDITKVSGRTAFDAMRLGDPAAKKVTRQYIEWVAYALTGFINMMQPEILVLGGGISHEGEALLLPLREIVSKESFDRYSQTHTQIVAASLGNDAGIIGAAFLANSL